MTSLDDRLKFDMGKALEMAKNSIEGNPLYPQKTFVDNPKLMELLVLTRALGMRDQYKLDQPLMNIPKQKRKSRDTKKED